MRSLQFFPRLQEACPYSCLAAFSLSLEFSQERNKPLWGRVCPFELLIISVPWRSERQLEIFSNIFEPPN